MWKAVAGLENFPAGLEAVLRFLLRPMKRSTLSMALRAGKAVELLMLIKSARRAKKTRTRRVYV